MNIAQIVQEETERVVRGKKCQNNSYYYEYEYVYVILQCMHGIVCTIRITNLTYLSTQTGRSYSACIFSFIVQEDSLGVIAKDNLGRLPPFRLRMTSCWALCALR